MNAKTDVSEEQKLIKLFVDTTGETEASARNLLMFLDLPEPKPNNLAPRPTEETSTSDRED